MHIVFLKSIRKPGESAIAEPIDDVREDQDEQEEEEQPAPEGEEGKSDSDMPADDQGEDKDEDGVPDGFGPHNVEVGHHVAFKAGEFSGSGKVNAAGDDGCTVSDKTGREHRVHWSEVTGHHPGA